MKIKTLLILNRKSFAWNFVIFTISDLSSGKVVELTLLVPSYMDDDFANRFIYHH